MTSPDKEPEQSSISIETLYPGSQIVHTIHVISVASVMAVSRMLSCLHGYDDALKSLHCGRDGGHIHQRIVLTGIDEREAKMLRDRLSLCDDILQVQLEHLIQRVTSDSH